MLSQEDLCLLEVAVFFKMPLYKLLDEMPYEELMMWLEYFKDHPPGKAEDYRAACIVSAFAPKAPIKELFPSLYIKKDTSIGGLLDSKMGQLILSSVGGIILEV